MNSNRSILRWTAGALVAALAVTSVAPAAQAHGRGGPRRYREYARPAAYYPGGVQIHHSSGVAPVILGVIGGIALGATIASAAKHHQDAPVYSSDDRGYEPPPPPPPPLPPSYYYQDPYCGQSFMSLDASLEHMETCNHPPIVQKIDQNGYCVGTFEYQPGGWRQRGEDWNASRTRERDWNRDPSSSDSRRCEGRHSREDWRDRHGRQDDRQYRDPRQNRDDQDRPNPDDEDQDPDWDD